VLSLPLTAAQQSQPNLVGRHGSKPVETCPFPRWIITLGCCRSASQICLEKVLWILNYSNWKRVLI